jgi:hypothetical protein
MLELRNVSKRFPGNLAVDHVIFSAQPRRDHRVSGHQWLRQIDHDEDDHRAQGVQLGRTPHGLRARGAASLQPPERAGVFGDGGATARPAGEIGRPPATEAALGRGVYRRRRLATALTETPVAKSSCQSSLPRPTIKFQTSIAPMIRLDRPADRIAGMPLHPGPRSGDARNDHSA